MSSQDKGAEKQYYEDLFRRRRRFDQFDPDIYERIADEARQGTRGNALLELGCGSGTQARALLARGFNVVALDLALEATRIARETVAEAGGTLAVVNGDAERLPVKDASVDACVLGLLLHHFHVLDGVAAEVARVVRPGGIVVAIDVNAHQPFAWMFWNVVHRHLHLKHVTSNQRALWSSEIRRVFTAHGFHGFRFDSVTSKLRRDWLGQSLGMRLNYYGRAAVLGLSQALPRIMRGNMLISVFRKDEAGNHAPGHGSER